MNAINPQIKRSGIISGVIIIKNAQNIKNSTSITIMSKQKLISSFMLYKELMDYLYE